MKLHYHPLSSFSWKALIAFYETGIEPERVVVNLGEEASRDAFYALYPIGKFPVVEDEGRVIPGSASIIEYLAHKVPSSGLIPPDFDGALRARMQDHFYDSYVHEQMQKITGDRLRAKDQTDPTGVEQARAMIRKAYGMIEKDMAHKLWAAGDAFTLADCAAAPALFYANKVEAIGHDRPHVTAYLERLKARASFARVLKEARPYFQYFPARPEDNHDAF